jgi:acyl-CoA thioesterase FadM
VLAKAVTTWALVEFDTGRPKRFTPEVRTAFGWDAAVATGS